MPSRFSRRDLIIKKYFIWIPVRFTPQEGNLFLFLAISLFVNNITVHRHTEARALCEGMCVCANALCVLQSNCVRVLCALGGISPGGAQRRLMLSVEQRIISLLAFPFIDFPLKNVPVTDEKLEKYGGDAAAFIQFRPFLPRSQCIKRWEMGRRPSQTFILSQMS